MNFNRKTYQTKVEQLIRTHQIPGVAVGINQSEEHYWQDFGYRDVERQLLITRDTVFGIASMTKSFTCMAIMKLQEDEKLSVHDPIVKFLPEFKAPNPEYRDQITIHHLMTHTAGFPPLTTHKYARKRSVDSDPSAKDYGLDLIEDEGEPIDTYEELIRYMSDLDYTMLGTPGTQFSYSNDSYGLLGVIIARASGQSYESYVGENILKPAKMINSFFHMEELETREDVAVLYASKQEGGKEVVYPAPIWWDAPSMRAGGYLKSTVNDILNFLEIIRNKGVVHSERILTAESVEQLIYPHVEFLPGRFYGYGFSVTPNYFGSTLIEHGGGLKGVSSFMSVVPEKELTSVVLTNLSGVPAGEIVKGAIHLIHQQNFFAEPLEYEEQPISNEKLVSYIGNFTSDEGMELAFNVVDNQLMLQSRDLAKDVPLRYIGDARFVTPENKEITFMKDDQKQVNRVFYSRRQILKDNL